MDARVALTIQFEHQIAPLSAPEASERALIQCERLSDVQRKQLKMPIPNTHQIYRLPRPPKEKPPINELLAAQETEFPDIYFPSLLRDLKSLKSVWAEVQSTRHRNAIYEFLEPVFELVTLYQRKGRERRLVKKIKKIFAPGLKTKDPFAAVIHCVVPLGRIDSRTRSKWSRALAYAQQHKRSSSSLKSFMLENGGINECASRCRQRG